MLNYPPDHPMSSSAIVDKARAREGALHARLQEFGSVVVAYSGGVDSTFLAVTAAKVLGTRALAVTADSPSMPRRRLAEACEWARRLGFMHRVISTREMDDAAYVANRPDRCFHCKREVFGRLTLLARAEGFAVVLDGANADDRDDYRPGSEAARELGVRSPLQDLGFTKAEIRALSRAQGLPTADQPASACLASRLPYGTPLTPEALARVERAEDALADLGFRQVRVRAHDEMARIEIAPEEMRRLLDASLRQKAAEAVSACGFRYVALDLLGYRTGSLNEGLARPSGA
jgi:uncharacterized protein